MHINVDKDRSKYMSDLDLTHVDMYMTCVWPMSDIHLTCIWPTVFLLINAPALIDAPPSIFWLVTFFFQPKTSSKSFIYSLWHWTGSMLCKQIMCQIRIIPGIKNGLKKRSKNAAINIFWKNGVNSLQCLRVKIDAPSLCFASRPGAFIRRNTVSNYAH